MTQKIEWLHQWKYPCSGLHWLGPMDREGQGVRPVEASG